MKTSKKYVRVFAGAVCAAVMMSGAVNAESFATVKGGGLNLRETASLDAKVLGQYPTGTWITVLEEGETWHKVSVDGKTGYMMNKYLSEDTAGTTMYVRTNTGIGLNLRTKPGMDGQIITSFRPGTAVNVLKKGSGWYLVSVNGQEGYMSSRFLAAQNVSYTKPVDPFTATLKNINGGSIVNFRLYPGMKTKIIRTYPVGTEVKVLEMGENWSLVEIDGQQGYVSTYFLKY
ncbi:MAG: SH3 domain-containing protein [Clostridia bacterium]|nr:SH3 domain-containing protein [Clostridia bacterium]